jgi:hypothetical protein
MVIKLNDIDLILISLEEMFGRATKFLAKESEKLDIEPEKHLVIDPEDGAIYLTYLDRVINDIKPILIPKLDEQGIDLYSPVLLSEVLWEDFQEVLDVTEYIEEEDTPVGGSLFCAIFQYDKVSKEGLEMTNISIREAMTSGVLSQWMEGADSYRTLQYIHENRYQESLKRLSSYMTYRTALTNRLQIKNRTL